MFFRSRKKICSTASSSTRRTACDLSIAIKSARSPPPTSVALLLTSRRQHCPRLWATPPSRQIHHRMPARRCTIDSVECSAEGDGPKVTDRHRHPHFLGCCEDRSNLLNPFTATFPRLTAAGIVPQPDPLRDGDRRIWFTIAPPMLLPVGRAVGRLSEQSCTLVEGLAGTWSDSIYPFVIRASSQCWARRPSRLQLVEALRQIGC